MLRYIGLILVILAIIGIATITVATLQKPSVSLFSQQGLYPISALVANIGDKTYFVLISHDIRSMMYSYKEQPYMVEAVIDGTPRMRNTPIIVEYMVIGTYMPVPKMRGAVSSTMMARFLQTIKSNIIINEKATIPTHISIRLNEKQVSGYKYVYIVLVYVVRRDEPISNFHIMTPSSNLTTVGDAIEESLNGIWSATDTVNVLLDYIRSDYFDPLWLSIHGYLIVNAFIMSRALLIAAIGIALIMIDYRRDPESVKDMFRLLSRRGARTSK
ncbi:MAG: hypothetical protein GXO43_07875 [Crenarchaeota archaeon]|nr:hypothetical protein [Thermoproteota archaeon]